MGRGKRSDCTLRVESTCVAVIAPPPGEHLSETNDNSVAVLLTYGRARVLLVGDA
jgi:hypothetical protein